MRVLAFLLLIGCSSLALAETQKEKEAAAIKKYDNLPDEWRDKCVEAWQKAYKKTKNSKLLKNDPPFYKPIFGNWEFDETAWGSLEASPHYSKDGLYVVEVISKTRILCTNHHVGLFFIDGLETSKMINERSYKFPGLYYVDGTGKYTTKSGDSNTYYVLRRVPPKAPAAPK